MRSGVAGERGGGAEAMDRPTRPRILPAVNAPMPHSSVRVVPEALTAVWMSAAALASGGPVTYLGDEVDGQAAQGLGRRHREDGFGARCQRPGRRSDHVGLRLV